MSAPHGDRTDDLANPVVRRQSGIGWEPPAPDARRLIAVIGTWSGGTTCVAGVLERLGVSMGARLERWCMEDRPLAQLCRSSFTHPFARPHDSTVRAKVPHEVWLAELRRYLRSRRGPLVGIKYPASCVFIPDLQAAWGSDSQVDLVVVRRGVRSTIASLRARGWMKGGDVEALVTGLLDARARGLEGRAWVDVSFEGIVEDPGRGVEELASALGLTVSARQRAHAAMFVGQPRHA